MSKKIAKVYRQGDVVLIPINALPKDVVEVPPMSRGVVLAEGEVTGHAHVLQPKVAKQYVLGSGSNKQEFVSITGNEGVLRHEEHSKISLPKGLYEKKICQEYTELGAVIVKD